jgi:multiple antibiotic resistance protein
MPGEPAAIGNLCLTILTETVFFLALVNPISKVFILTVMAKDFEKQGLLETALRSTLVALGILVVLALGGSFILVAFFHVQVHSLRVAGGAVLFAIGFQALTKGKFFEAPQARRLSDISIVPLASPMIAGPATIAAAISETAHLGFAVTGPALFLALAVNFVIMLLALRIGGFLSRFNLMGALIRITGLFVAAIAVEMVLSGIQSWLEAVRLTGT